MRTRLLYAGLALAALTMSASCSDAMRHRAATLKAIAGAVASENQAPREQAEGGDDLLRVVTPDSVPSMILERTGYVTSYNKNTKLPNWVAWHLTAEHTKGSHSRKGIDFMEDEDVPTPRADDWDYYNSRYDRGHMCRRATTSGTVRPCVSLSCSRTSARRRPDSIVATGTRWRMRAAIGRVRMATYT